MDKQVESLKNTETPKKSISIALIAIGCSLAPFISLIINLLGIGIYSSIYFMIIAILPIIGLVFGIMYLSQKKDQKNSLGTMLAIIAIIIPVFFIVVIVIYFVASINNTITMM